jgi:alpha-beta hydrolase superfamily lysophospholipase
MRPRDTSRIDGIRRLLDLLLVTAFLAGCASPQLQERASEFNAARLTAEEAIMDDGYRLPLRRWGDPAQSNAILLALHGFNDYGNAFAHLGPYLATRGFLTYAYDQRGFGATTQRGRWAGEDRMIADIKALARLLRERYPEIPLFLLGESMGGALVMSTVAQGKEADGVILVSPAVWSRETMNPIQRLILQAAAHTLPWLELTGRGLGIRPSDNLEMLRDLGADPMVIKRTRVDALWGVTNVMDQAMDAAHELTGPALLLYGEHDEIIPENAFCTMLERMPKYTSGVRIMLYRNGWHMLTRDLQGKRVMADIAAWLRDPGGYLPSGEETQPGGRRLERFCHS